VRGHIQIKLMFYEIVICQICVSNFMFVGLTLTVFRFVACNAQKFKSRVTPIRLAFREISKGHARSLPGNMHVRYGVRLVCKWLNVFELKLNVRCTHTQTDKQTRRQTYGENIIICAVYSIHLAETKKIQKLPATNNRLKQRRIQKCEKVYRIGSPRIIS